MLFVSYPHAESNRNRQNRNLKFYPLNYRGRFQPFYDRRIHSDNHANLIRFCYFSHKNHRNLHSGRILVTHSLNFVNLPWFNDKNMKTAYIFPGQGSQYSGMAKDLYEHNPEARQMLESANEILGFRITDIMFEGSSDDLKRTDVTQPAIFLHSVVLAKCLQDFRPDMVAGHSLGEFSALVAAGALSFEDGLKLVSMRAKAMQKACEIAPGAMAAVLMLPSATVEAICAEVSSEPSGISHEGTREGTSVHPAKTVVPANYNCEGQIVISGDVAAVEEACVRMKEAGARRALPLPVGGAFHSPLMEPAREELAAAIEQTSFTPPICPIYQNVNALPSTDPAVLKDNLLAQLTSPVRWTQSVKKMLEDGVERFVEIGPGKVLQGLVAKTAPSGTVIEGISAL